jgi:hypothetical protein
VQPSSVRSLSRTRALVVLALPAEGKFSFWGGAQASNSPGVYGQILNEVASNVMPSRYYHGAAIDANGDLW